MKKLLYIIAIASVLFSISCKEDFLDVKSPSVNDEEFIFSSPGEAQKVLMSMYNVWITAYYRHFYDFEITGSDIEKHPETFAGFEGRVVQECFYNQEPTTIDISNAIRCWNAYFQVANRANIVMEAIAEKEEYKKAVAASTANEWTQLYGEAAVFRAFSYFQLIKLFGDVPYFDKATTTLDQTDPVGLTSRFVIYDGEIANLTKVEPLMYPLGKVPAERFSRTFAQALIGKICLFAGGWSTCRTDFDYGNVSFETKGPVKWQAQYVRVLDYKTKYYEVAKTYLDMCVGDPGSAYLITSDSREGDFNNPFQLHFQNLMDLNTSPESLFEIGTTQSYNGDYTYSFGRPSDGGGSNSYPCKSYGQSRIYSSFYYGDFSPLDKRRDVTVAVTANSGNCSEKIINFTPGNKSKGGLGNNKLDESRMDDPYTAKQRKSGVNVCQMRMADVILMLAEVNAVLGFEGEAKNELTKVRSRAFDAADQATEVTNYINALSGDALLDAILDERKFEFAGEGLTRYDLIRTAKIGQKIKERRDAQIAMVNDLKSQGYHTFDNGNQISNYIWTKAVNGDDFGMKNMLTTECTVAETDPTWPIRYPGWRGTSDAWSQFSNDEGERNLAIQGLFRYIDPDGPEAAALEADGYVKTEWGFNIQKSPNDLEYTDIWRGYTDADVAAGTPPRYFWPLSSLTISQSKGLITNGYGFAQQ